MMVSSANVFAQETTTGEQPFVPKYNLATLNPFDYALLATGDNGVDVKSAIANINANVYSGGDFKYSGSQLTLNGECNVVGKIIKTNASIQSENENVDPLQMDNHILDIKNLLSADPDVLEGDVAMTSPPVKDSVINGKLTIANASLNLGPKIIAKDDIVINSSVISSDENQPFILASESGNINITASYSNMNGFIYAPNGTVKINSSIANISGIIIAKEIIINSSSCTVTNNTICTEWLADFEAYLPDDGIIDQADIERLLSKGLISVIRESDGSFRTIDGKFTKRLVNSEADAAAVLNSARSLFGNGFSVNTSDVSVETVALDKEEYKQSFYRYNPTVNGIPVSGSQIVLATNGDGVVSGLFSTYDKRIKSISTTSTITKQQAIEAATNKVISDEAVDAFLNSVSESSGYDYDSVKAEFLSTVSTDAELLVYVGSDNSVPTLAWAVKLSNQSTSEEENGDVPENETALPTIPNISEIVYIYANGSLAGKVLISISNVQEAATIMAKDLKGIARPITVAGENGEYVMRDDQRKINIYETKYSGEGVSTKVTRPGDIVKFSDVSNADKAAVSALYNVSKVYDYYKDILGSKSYDCKGSPLNVSLNYNKDKGIGKKNRNAEWDPDIKQMSFGDDGNFEGALDLVGHEFTHAVISNIGISNQNKLTDKGKSILENNGESGALQESYCDIMMI